MKASKTLAILFGPPLLAAALVGGAYAQPKARYFAIADDTDVSMMGAPSMSMSGSMSGANDAGVEFFEKKIRPLLATNCYGCHSDAKKRAGLSLESRDGWERGGKSGPAIIPGKPEQSLLIKAVSYKDENLQMPPMGQLSPTQIADLTAWVKMGAPDPRRESAASAPDDGTPKHSGLTPEARKHWAWQPLHHYALPKVKNGGWVKSPLDAFVLAKLEAQGLQPAPQADRKTLIRRATFILTGLPPTVGEVRAFLSDSSPDAWPKVVDRLLASPHFGETWGRHWLDTARYSDTRGLNSDGGKYRFEDYRYQYAWTYRDYVVKAFNDDKPYDQFLTEQIAADKLPDIQLNDPRLAALGFLTVGKRFENPDDTIDERIDTVTKATQALTVACARCHDHKFDPIPTADYYSLHGIFASSMDEPYEKPMVALGDPRARDDYERKLADLERENRDIYYRVVQKRLKNFQDNAEGWLAAATRPYGSPSRQEAYDKWKLTPDKEIDNALKLRRESPVFGPLVACNALKDADAAKFQAELKKALEDKKRVVNPLVVRALTTLQPKSMDELVAAYGKIFTRIKPETEAYFQARATAEDPKVAPEMAQLIETPYPIPPASEINTTEKLMAVYQKLPLENATVGEFLFSTINALRLTHPGAPGGAMIVRDADKPQDSYIHIRGDRNRHGDVVPRRYLEIISGPNRPAFTQGSGRLELARAIADAKNPLTSRAAVNRIWMYLFGEGFVRTPDDLGNMSEPPSHPELLDYLAGSFSENWSVKKLIRGILLSNAWQEGAQNDANQEAVGEAKDADNRLLWRANLRRIDFEAMRDSLVLLSGKMDNSIGGKPVNLTDEPYSYRRSIYGYVDRGGLSNLLMQFDYADPASANSRRYSTIVPQQALFFLNSPMAIDAARQAVARAEFAHAPDDAARVQNLYETFYQRSPRPQEVEWATEFIARATTLAATRVPPKSAPKLKAAPEAGKAMQRKEAALKNEGWFVPRAPLAPWELYAQALLCSNEFVYVR